MNELCVCLSWAAGLSLLPARQSGSPSPQPTPKKSQLPAFSVTGAVSFQDSKPAAVATIHGARDCFQTSARFLLLTLPR